MMPVDWRAPLAVTTSRPPSLPTELPEGHMGMLSDLCPEVQAASEDATTMKLMVQLDP